MAQLDAVFSAMRCVWAGVLGTTLRPPIPYAGPGVVNGTPFFAKISARSFAGWLLLALFDTSCVLPGGSKNISPGR